MSGTRSGMNETMTSSGAGAIGLTMMYLTFEDAAHSATDIVIAEFVTQRPFGQTATEFEFIVHERISGDAAEIIFVYAFNDADFSVAGIGHSFADGERRFKEGESYLLLLEKIGDVYASFHHNGFFFITDLILDLSNPSKSTMYGEPLTAHSSGINFNIRNLTREDIISYVGGLAQNNIPIRSFIASENLEDIIEGSPYVLVVEITEPRRMASQGFGSDLRSTDIYYVTVVESLKGDIQIGDVIRVIFFADTVFLGEKHIVSIVPRVQHDPYFHGFTSRNSLHSIDQLDEIITIISGNTTPTPSTHTITFHSGDQGTFTNNETTITKEIEISQSSSITQVPNPQPSFGWEFVGWHYDGARWPISTDDVMALQITEDITFTAQYDILFHGQVIEVILEGITDFSIRGPGGDDVYRQHMTIYRETMTDHIPTKVGEIKSIITDNDVPGYHILLDENFFYIFEDMIFVDAGTIHSVMVVSSSGWTDYYENFLNDQDPWQNEIALFVSNRESMLSEWGIGWMRTVDDRLEFEVLTSSREENGSLEQIHSLELEVGLSE